MQRDGEVVIVHPPQLLEQELGLAANVDEHQRGLVALDQVVDLSQRVASGVSRPRQALFGVEHLDDRRSATLGDHEIGLGRFTRCLRDKKARERFRLGDGRREARHRDGRSEAKQPRQPERQQIAALGGDEGMQLVQHEPLQRAEHERGVGRRQQQRQLLGRGQEHVGRIAALALAARHRRVAGAGLDLDPEPHLGDRPLEVARDIDGERLQRRDVERVEAARANFFPRVLPTAPLSGVAPPSSTRVGRNPASVLPAPVGAISSAERCSRAFRNSAS